MSPKEKQARETVITFLMKQLNISRKQSITNMKELEEFGLIVFDSDGNFGIKGA
ncbi:hypothetical protein SAMN02910293_00509 [Streptococcus henryi]|uniref:Uncharacterized protein n=1 Tax=Streptococcus henryi TaxID=439219 RepID=A0A1G6AMM2_9STRE|nr:hypothetical protein [Streptococcus henryi]SDB09656.1 hypothetical protein SAMN02910293_00509 [Streptococcus henryi]